MAEPLLTVEDLTVGFSVRPGWTGRSKRWLQAVAGVSFEIGQGETLGLVGESGCGKTTTGLAVLRLAEASGGRVVFDGENVLGASEQELRALRRRMSMVFQDPFSSLNPRKTVGSIVAEPLVIHRLGGARQGRQQRVGELLELVGINPDHRHRYPHEFSGGQRQRVGIARALASDPDFIVCDEPIASLDVSVQAQILNLLDDLQDEFGLAYLFIAHDLAAVQHIADRIAVMYLGRIVEVADRVALYTTPKHPYTEALLSAVPLPDPDVEEKRTRIILSGDVPSPVTPPSGCRFRTRCPQAFNACSQIDPHLQDVGGGQIAACHLHGIAGEPV